MLSGIFDWLGWVRKREVLSQVRCIQSNVYPGAICWQFWFRYASAVS